MNRSPAIFVLNTPPIVIPNWFRDNKRGCVILKQVQDDEWLGG
jgi:hypothetical protein